MGVRVASAENAASWLCPRRRQRLGGVGAGRGGGQHLPPGGPLRHNSATARTSACADGMCGAQGTPGVGERARTVAAGPCSAPFTPTRPPPLVGPEPLLAPARSGGCPQPCDSSCPWQSPHPGKTEPFCVHRLPLSPAVCRVRRLCGRCGGRNNMSLRSSLSSAGGALAFSARPGFREVARPIAPASEHRERGTMFSILCAPTCLATVAKPNPLTQAPATPR